MTADHGRVFTGDALLVRGAGRTDFQHGDAHRLFASIRDQLFTLPDDCVVCPAHDYEGRTSSTIREERAFNPRIGGGASEEDFVGYMRNLALPHPKQIAAAVPANLRAGEPPDGQAPAVPAWGPVVTTYAGFPEIAPEWVAHHRAHLRILDVRTPAEAMGELGQLTGAAAHPARRSPGAPRRDRRRQTRGRRLSDRPPLGDGDGDPPPGGPHPGRQHRGRHGPLARPGAPELNGDQGARLTVAT